MRIDRDLYKSLKEDIFKDKASYKALYDMVENQNFNDAENYLKEKYFNNSRTLDNLRLSLGLDVNISIKELLLYVWFY